MQTLDQLVEELYNKFTLKKSFISQTPIVKQKRAQSALKKQSPNPRQILFNATQVIERKQALISSINTIKFHRSSTVCKTEESNKPVRFERYSILQKIAVGAFSIVYKAYDRMTDQYVAIKQYNSKFLVSEQKKMLIKESEILRKLDHQNIVKFQGIYKNTLVLEYIEGQTLKNFLKSQEGRKLQEIETIKLFDQLKDAIQYLHTQNVCHRDLKADNIMIQNDQLKLIDFGLSSNVEECTDYCGTPAYMAPELLQKRQYEGKKADLWASGVILYQMLFGKVPFPGKNDEDIIKSQIIKLKFPRNTNKELLIQLYTLLQKDPQKRKW